MTKHSGQNRLLPALVRESLRSGTMASIAMIPFGLTFRALDMRVGYYGEKLMLAMFSGLDGPALRIAVMIEHFIIGWLTAWPLLLAMMWFRERIPEPMLGLAYGIGYYMIINAWLLPVAFNDPSPWQLGWQTVLPSLVVHIVFGLTIALTGRRFTSGPGTRRI